MEEEIKAYINHHSEEIFGQVIPENLIQFQKTRKDINGDLTLITFPIVKLLKKSPTEIANQLGELVRNGIEYVDSYDVINGFLNLNLTNTYWLNLLKEINSNEKFGFEKIDSKSSVMVEFCSPNTNKPLHLGHLRNIFLGDSVSEILKANGHRVIKTQIINDRGIHICKSMLAWDKYAPIDSSGIKENPKSTGIKGDHFVGKYYIEFDKQQQLEAFEIANNYKQVNYQGLPESKAKQLSELFKILENLSGDESKIKSVKKKITELTKDETSLIQEAQKLLLKWEARDPETFLLWTTMNSWVYKGFNETYQKLGVEFDHLYYESDTFSLGKDVVLNGLKSNIFYQKEDGSVWADLTADGLDEKLLLRNDGTTVYMTQDVGTAIDRIKDYPNLKSVVYTVGNEQDYHFKVLFLLLEKLGFEWAKNCYHLSYGMVDLPDGKMKSREGKVVDADDLIEEVIAIAKENAKERGHLQEMDEVQKDNLYSLIGLGGLKYFLLKVDPQKRMKFNPEESIDLNGNTGPFIQYTYARIQSLLRKNTTEINAELFQIGNSEKELIKLMSQFKEMVEEAGRCYSPAIIANYAYELAKAFNTFYQNFPVLNEENETLKNARLMIVLNIGKIIRLATSLLGIQVPDRM